MKKITEIIIKIIINVLAVKHSAPLSADTFALTLGLNFIALA